MKLTNETYNYVGETFGYGQGSSEERLYVYNTVLKNCYANILECGTMEGGGTTYAISCALHKLNLGKLITYETDPHFFATSVLKYLRNSYVDIRNDSFDVTAILSEKSVDMIMYDCIRNIEINERHFKLALKLIRSGGSLVIHDWNADHSNLKMTSLNDIRFDEYMKTQHEWELITVLNNTTGLAHFQRR